MSRLIVIDPDTCQDPEPECLENGYCICEELPTVSMTTKVSPKVDVTLNEITISFINLNTDLQLDVTHKQLHPLQQEHPFWKRIKGLLKSSKLQTKNPYYMEDELLMRNTIDSKQCFLTMVLPQVLTTGILRAVHDELGHNGFIRAYMIVQRLYYWKGLRASVNKHIKQCMTCEKRNIQAVKYTQLHFSTQRPPMQSISLD